MKVAQIAALYKPNTGGLEAVMHQLSDQLVAKGHNVTIFTSDYRWRADYKDLKYKNLQIYRLKSTRIAGLVVMPSLLYRLLKAPHFQIYHVHVSQAFIPETVLIAAKIKRTPVILHFHLDVEPSGKFGFIFKMYKKLILPRTLRSADKVIVFTESQAQVIQQKYGVEPQRISIIPNAVQEDFFIEKKREIRQKPRLLFVGRLSVQKNIQQLLYALQGVSDQFKTDIVGDGELREELEGLIENLKLVNVTFHGHTTGKKLLKFYEQADIFVLPSEREGMPLVLLEAMAARLPIVATNVTGISDLVLNDENGLLVPYGDFKVLQTALLKLHSDKIVYEKMSQTSRRLAKQYSWEKIIKQFEHLYETSV
jgi:rhamnosyl/mannosyltransferase